MPIEILVNSSDSGSVVKKYDKNEVVIGRHSSNDFVLDKDGISERHARVKLSVDDSSKSSKIFVTDLGSKEGVKVNDSRIGAFKEVEISPNDKLRIGDVDLAPIFSVEEGPVTSKKTIRSFFGKGKEEADSAKVSYKDKDIKLKAGELAEEVKGPDEAELDAKLAKTKSEPKQIKSEPKKSEAAVETKSTETKAALAEKKPVQKETPKAATSSKEEPTCSKVLVFESGVDGETLEVDFEAQKLLSLKGSICRKNAGVEGVEIDGGALGKTKTSKDGKFEFLDVTEGTKYDLSATLNGYVIELKNSKGTLEDDFEVHALAEKLVSVKGTIVNKGKPVEGVTVKFGDFGTSITDSKGAYEFTRIPESVRVKLEVSKPGFQFAKQG